MVIKESAMKAKRIFAAIMAAVLVALSCVSAFAADSYFSLNGFSFEINSQGEAVIREYDKSESSVVIPEKLLGAKVTEIADYAFFGDSEMTSISFEKARWLKKIGSNAFYGCSGLTTLSIADSVAELGFGAFQSCGGLESVTLSSSLNEIPSQCFYNCDKLNGVIIGENVTKIGDYAFGSCTALDDIFIPAGVTVISKNAFSGCGDLHICCYAASAAHEFATENNIPYTLVDDYPLGDADGDKCLTINDATYIQMYDVGMWDFERKFLFLFSDINNDGEVDVRDATFIQMRLAGMI